MKYKNLISARRFFFPFIYVLISMSFYSCSEKYEFNRTEQLLIEHDWEIKTYVDYSQNQTTEFRNAVYNFKEDNSLTKAYVDSDTITTSWELSADSEFLTIGSNTFKITAISNRVLSLRYGEIEIFFVRK